MSKFTLTIDSIIFDLDGVITNTMPDHYKAWKSVLKEEGVDATYEDIYLREGQPGTHSVREIFEKYQKPYQESHALKILKRKEDYFKNIVKTRFILGARSFIKRLKSKKFRLAIVTGTARHEVEKMLSKKLLNNFDVIVTGSDVKWGKPHPEPYLKSLEQLNIHPDAGVVIENAPFGIRSAKAAGLTCLALETSLERKYLKEADGVYKSVKELEKKVKFQNQKTNEI